MSLNATKIQWGPGPTVGCAAQRPLQDTGVHPKPGEFLLLTAPKPSSGIRENHLIILRIQKIPLTLLENS